MIKPRAAGRQLHGLGLAVAGGAALDHIGHVGISVAVDASGSQQLIEQLAGATHKRQASAVFLSAGSLADQHQPGGGIAPTHHHLLPVRGQITAATGCAIEQQLPQEIGRCRGRCRHGKTINV